MKCQYSNFEALPLVLDAEHVRRVLGLSRAATYSIMRSRGFPSIRAGRRLITGRDAFQRWLNQQGQSA